MTEQKSPIEYKPLTRKELTVLTLERIREERIVGIINNDILLDAVKIEKEKGGKSSAERTKMIQEIRNREGLAIQMEEDLKLVQRKLKEVKGKLNEK